MLTGDHRLFTHDFRLALRQLVELHHSLYPRIPPQGIFFESLVERAFLKTGWDRSAVKATPLNIPSHDLAVGSTKISVKTETGASTKENSISITKLCTTETGEWNSKALIEHALKHLERYEHILMLRAVWRAKMIHYQLLDIPLNLLKLIAKAVAMPVGRRKGRQSLAVSILHDDTCLFRVHFDGADGKCQIHRLRVDRCLMLLEWDIPVAE